MPKRFCIILAVVLLAVGIMGVITLDHLFPKAGPIKCPQTEDILTFVTYTHSSGHVEDSAVTIPSEDHPVILEQLSKAKPTRKMSVQDTPGRAEYYSIEIKTDSRMYCYFLYTEYETIYLEMPYEGIYIAGNDLLQTIQAYHKGDT